jgi:hypothetical protein
MISEKQLTANRNNGLKSTGPRTPEGKRNASRNAVRHGLLSDSAEVLLKGENQDEFDSFHQNLLINLDPQGQLEVLLAERITGFFWKLKRAGRMEKGLLDILCNPSADSDSPSKKDSLEITSIVTKTYLNPSEDPEYREFKKLKQQQAVACGFDPSENRIISPETFRFIPALQKTEKQSLSMDNSSAESLGKAIQHDFKSGSLLERLLRYEGQIERSLYKALSELQKFQFIRNRNEAINVGADLRVCPDSNVDEASSFIAEKPNEPISVGADPCVCPVASAAANSFGIIRQTSAVSNVTEASRFGDSPGHPEPSEGSDSVVSRDASGTQQLAAGSPNPDTGYFYHSPPCRPVPPQRHASHSGMSLSHLSDEQLDQLSKQIV